MKTVYSNSFEQVPLECFGIRRLTVLGEERFREENSAWDADVLPPSRGVCVIDWSPAFKLYPHFDKPIRANDIDKLVRNPGSVARNAFYPFLRFEEKWQPFRTKIGGKPNKKVRELRFASRRDAYIYSYYRFLLQKPYEALLEARNLSANVIAYRKLTTASGRVKSNIDFALDAVKIIQAYKTAAVVTLDISKYFETIDHSLLRQKWCMLLKTSKLPPGHAAVFRAITKYAVVDRDTAYERLGYLRQKFGKTGKPSITTTSYKDMPRQLCSNTDFREKICGKGGKYSCLIERHSDDFGIPQGSPISDILANLYLGSGPIELLAVVETG